jgi:4-aminobutyrate aminotransferase / (S)-3-amino-2-methylpropionate transaminase / 5-aminovalerate transaminase
MVFSKGLAHTLWDSSGRPYLDFINGYSANNLGHLHPGLVQAAQEQLTQLAFCTGGSCTGRGELEKKLAEIWKRSSAESGMMNQNPAVWLSSTGARAVEIAWKIAFANRPGSILRFDLAYHGRSLATAEISDTPSSLALKKHLDARAAKQFVVPYPRCGSSCKGFCDECQSSLELVRQWLPRFGEQTSAMILEPAIGARGYFFASSCYYRQLVKLLRDHGILVIADEIQMGLGRWGAMMASCMQGWVPDLAVFGKSLGGGIATIAAVVGKASMMDRLPQGIESETFAANPFACRIGLASLQLLNDEGLLGQVRRNGSQYRDVLRKVLPSSAKVDGIGLATVIDLSENGERGEGLAWNLVREWRENGLLVHLTGPNRDRIALIPALNVPWQVLEQSVGIIKQSFPRE